MKKLGRAWVLTSMSMLAVGIGLLVVAAMKMLNRIEGLLGQ